jgi:catechol 2,3-dioxygenase-like lactoylglutathione lyase family enzyme
MIRVNNIDNVFKKFVERGLDNSAVHRGPVNQTWGVREFYVADPDGNTLRFGEQTR